MKTESDRKYIKRCFSCGKWLKRSRWMEIGCYMHKRGAHPICWSCDASYD